MKVSLWLEPRSHGVQNRIPSSNIANYIFRYIYFTKRGMELHKQKDSPLYLKYRGKARRKYFDYCFSEFCKFLQVYVNCHQKKVSKNILKYMMFLAI